MPNPSRSIQERILAARVVLFVAFVLTVVSLFFPLPHLPNQPAWKLWEWGFNHWKNHFDFSISTLVYLAFILCDVATLSLIVAAPWLIGALSRFKAFLWMLRILFAGRTGLILWYSFTLGPAFYGYNYFLEALAIAMETLGLFLVPTSPRHQSLPEN
jgi:hypothetical protein